LSNLQLFAVCVLIWGSTWIAITFQLGEVAPELSVAYRFLIASAVMFVFCAVRRHRLRFNLRQHGSFIALGLSMFCISYIFVYHAERFVASAMVAVAYSASPFMSMVGMRLFFGAPMKSSTAFASTLGVLGICCIFYPQIMAATVGNHAEAALVGEAAKNQALGLFFTVASVVGSVAGSLVATKNHKLGLPLFPGIAWGMFYGGLGALIIALALGRPLLWGAGWQYTASMLYLALFGSLITFACYLTLMGRVGADRSAYIGVMVPIVALIFSALFEKFQFGWLTFFGVGLSVLGNVVMLRTQPQKTA
jgi:drug/metabolite transporter (DMT)-like permease